MCTRLLPILALLPLSAAQAASFPPEVSVGGLRAESGADGTVGITLISATERGGVGRYLASPGDLNDDGVDDIAISAGVLGIYVYFGSTTVEDVTFRLDGLIAENGGDGSLGFLIRGVESPRIGGAGDVNGDGIADLLVASQDDAFLIYGSDSGFPAEIDLATLSLENGGDGSVGTVLRSPDETRVGEGLAAAGDVNDDGRDDFIVTVIGVDCTEPFICATNHYLVFGRDQSFGAELSLPSLLQENGGDGSAGVVLRDPVQTRNDRLFRPFVTTAGVGDLNGDGVADLALAAPDQTQDTVRGLAYVLYGRDAWPAEFDLPTLQADNGGDGSDGFVVVPVVASDFAAVVVAAPGDVDGDGMVDLLVGANGVDSDDSDTGATYLIRGQRGGFGAELEIASLLEVNGGDGSVGTVFDEGASAGAIAELGVTVAAAGDVNADGVRDFLISRTEFLRTEFGRVYLVYGRHDGFGARVDLSTFEAQNGGRGDDGVIFLAADPVGDFQIPNIAGDFDLNGDGLGDFLIGDDTARGIEEGDADINGEGYVFFGRLPSSLSARIVGMDTRSAACRNVTIDQTVSIGLAEFSLDESFDCGFLGLDFLPDEQIVLQADGVNFGAALNGEVAGLGVGANVICENTTTAQSVTADIVDGLWDCEAAGLASENQDALVITVRGVIEPFLPEQPALALTLSGMDTRGTACQNLTTGELVNGSLPDVRLVETIDCDALGLVSSADDQVTIQGQGRNFGATLTGEMSRLGGQVEVRCDNRTTGVTRFIVLPEGEAAFDCVAAGVAVNNQDAVTVTVRGLVE
ncbi:MAG: FG-GAP repeat protein [Pseudomonadota bacterium]